MMHTDLVKRLLLPVAFAVAGDSAALSIDACWKIDEKRKPHIAFSVTNQERKTVVIRNDKLPWSIDSSAYYVFTWEDGLVIPHDRLYRIDDPLHDTYTELEAGKSIEGSIDLSYHFDLGKDADISDMVAYWNYSFVSDSSRTDFHKTFYFYRDDDRCKAFLRVD